MNCKCLYSGAVNFRSLEHLSSECLHALSATLFDYSDRFGLSNEESFRLLCCSTGERPKLLSLFLSRLGVDSVTISKQFEDSRFFPAKFRVNFHTSYWYTVYDNR